MIDAHVWMRRQDLKTPSRSAATTLPPGLQRSGSGHASMQRAPSFPSYAGSAHEVRHYAYLSLMFRRHPTFLVWARYAV